MGILDVTIRIIYELCFGNMFHNEARVKILQVNELTCVYLPYCQKQKNAIANRSPFVSSLTLS